VRTGLVYLGKHQYALMFLLIYASFTVPFVILYQLDAQSFNATWKGRTFYLFFLWLAILELVMDWERLQSPKAEACGPLRAAALTAVLLLPTAYVIVENTLGLNKIIVDLANQLSVPLSSLMPLAVEYLVFAGVFAVAVTLAYGFDGLSVFSVSAVFLGAVGAVYLIDNLYPYGQFTPLQVFVPPTVGLATGILNLMGYQTAVTQITNNPTYGTVPYLTVEDSMGRTAGFAIAWPCSGVQSLFIYTIVIALFLKRTPIRWLHRLLYFAVGAVVTYLINALRIVTIFTIALNNGDWVAFHNYYGELYSMTWIIAYPLIIIGSRILWNRTQTRKAPHTP
jgi:thaumarchaeosortase